VTDETGPTRPDKPHFQSVDSWSDAAELLAFEPAVPMDTAGHALESLAVFVRDHRMRELPPEDRSLEAFYSAFVFTQSHHSPARAREAALATPYGLDPRPIEVGVHEGRGYERGPDPAPGDPDPPMPAVVVWHAGAMFYLLASEELDVAALLRIARSVPEPGAG
jgi:hypothetical protein